MSSFVENWFDLAGGARTPWFDFAAGRLEHYFAILFGFIGLMVLLYSVASVRGRKGQVAEYFVFLVILVACALGVVFARNLILIFVFWELVTFSLWRMVLYSRTEEGVAAAGWAWLVNFAAATMMLVGIAIILFEEKTVSLDRLAGVRVDVLPAALVLVGIVAKSAALPLYVWLPKAYRTAPAPVCALLSGVAENVGAVLFFKFFVATVAVPEGFMAFVAGLAVVTSLVAGGVALRAPTMRGTLAFSTVSQLGFVFLGVAMMGYYGLMGGFLYVLAHAVAKAGLFFSVGVVADAAGTDELGRLGGMAGRSPALAAASALLMMSIMGMPPLMGFFAKFGVVLGVLDRSLLLGVGAVVAALFTILYLVKLYVAVFLGSTPVGTEWRPVNSFLVGIVVFMALVSLAGGVFVFFPVRFLESGILAVAGVF